MDFTAARHNMVESQIKPNRVTDPLVIRALADLPREAFVPETLEGIAYVDEAIHIGSARYMMEPMVLARLLQAAEVEPDDVALVIGCGSGYEAAVMSALTTAVVALESDKGFFDESTATLAELGFDAIAVVDGPDLARGYQRQAPYDVIFINGAIPEIPERIAGQLAEGGRLVAIVGNGSMGKGTLMTRFNGVLTSREVFDAGTPPLPGFEMAEAFSF
ncbi:MAG: protein-L-isoaspartate O-methyltransferase [Rhodospirillaceae bacterium]|nr:protein-L-isoaspartate O-methyltransferase [Rhodospirillaceae bacterium]